LQLKIIFGQFRKWKNFLLSVPAELSLLFLNL
jgi:hypothetical protein